MKKALYGLRFQRFCCSGELPKPPKGCCKWCGGESKLLYCSEFCRNECYVRMGYRIDYLLCSRDKGICAGCGIDVMWLGSEIRRITRTWRINRQATYSEMVRDFGPWGFGFKRIWEADHIIPVIEGGGCCGLENYQTLCVLCHKKDSAELAKRRANCGGVECR